MEKETSWHSIEGAIKSLSTQLQSFPDEIKEKALRLLGTQLNNCTDQVSNSSRNNTTCQVLKEEAEDRNEIAYTSLTSLKNDTVVSEASTSSSPRKRRRERQPKPKAEEPCFEAEIPCVKRGLRSATRQKNGRTTEADAVKQVIKTVGKKVKLKDNGVSQSTSAELVKKTAGLNHKKRNEANSIESEENDSVAPVIVQAEKKEAHFLDHSEDNEETSTSSTVDAVNSLLKGRKRGRPRKFETGILEIKSEECGVNDFEACEENSMVMPKKPGRPRQSSYSSGYVPKAKNFQCMDCGKMLATRQSYREHQRQHTGEGFICDNCGQKFTTSSGFMLHKRYHSDDPHMYKCSKCKYVVSSQQLLDDHYLLRHDPNRPKSHICDVCGKAFHGSTQLEKHLFSHSNTKPYSCDQCSFSTAYPGGLEKHKYNVHITDRTLFHCELCGIHLKSKGTYIEHIGRHFNQRKKKCETCEKTFPNASQLAAHRRCHLEPTVPCEICGKKLRSKHKLKVHELIHSGQKDFKCPCCSYVTYVKHNLKKHCMARHKMDYPPRITQKMKKFKLSDVSSGGFKDPLALKCLSKLNSSVADEPAEAHDDDGATPAASDPSPASAALYLEEKPAALYVEDKPVNASQIEFLPMTKVEMIAASEPKTFMTEEKMYVTLSTIDRNAIIDIQCPAGTFYPTNLYVPTLVTSDQQLT